MLSLDLSSTKWRTSSYSGNNGTCVEVGFAAAAVAVRDTKDRDGGTIAVSPSGWSSFVDRLKHGSFDRH